jgi:tetratricopeptide (TPR) repeat protein
MAWYNKGKALYDLNKPIEALKAFDKAIEINPQYEDAWDYEGLTLYRLSKYEDAIKAFDKAIEINPNSKA